MWYLKTQGLIQLRVTRSVQRAGEAGKESGEELSSCTIHVSVSRGQINSKQKAELFRIQKKMLRLKEIHK